MFELARFVRTVALSPMIDWNVREKGLGVIYPFNGTDSPGVTLLLGQCLGEGYF